MKEQKQGVKIKPIHIALFSVGAIAVVAAAVILIILFSRTNDVPENEVIIVTPQGGGRGMVVTQENVEEMREWLDSPIEDGYYETRMSIDWVFPNSSEPSTTAYIENSTNNTRTVYFDLFLADTSELIYSSPFIPVGARLEGFALDAHVPAGEYSGIVTYHLVDDDFEEITTVSVGVTLRVLG